MVDISLINGKVTLISTKLYPRIAFYHFLKFWKKYTTLTLFLKGRLTKKRTETKYTKQNRANALLWNFFPHPAVGDIQLLFTISPLIILWKEFTKWGSVLHFFRHLEIFKQRVQRRHFSKILSARSGNCPTLGKPTWHPQTFVRFIY